MNYIITEIQTTGGVTTVVTPVIKNTEAEAWQAFHQACAYAAVSGLDIHTVVIENAEGFQIERKCFKTI